MAVGECFFDVMKEHGEAGFGAANLITLHPILGDDLVNMLAVLCHEIIHHMLPPEAKHKKPFQIEAEKIGLTEPWTATKPDATLSKKLQGILVQLEDELGFLPEGFFKPPPPPPKKPSSVKKFFCGCGKPRVLSLSSKKLEEGPILCGICKQTFRTEDQKKKANG